MSNQLKLFFAGVIGFLLAWVIVPKNVSRRCEPIDTLISIDNQAFEYSSQGFTLAGNLITDLSKGDLIAVDHKVEEMEELTEDINNLADRRQKVLQRINKECK